MARGRSAYGGSVANGPELRTARLLLRRWRDSDRAPFAALNADPEVMRHFPKPLTTAESDAFVDRVEAAFGLHGYGLWAVERDGGFIGFVGLNWTPFNAHFTPVTTGAGRARRSLSRDAKLRRRACVHEYYRVPERSSRSTFRRPRHVSSGSRRCRAQLWYDA